MPPSAKRVAGARGAACRARAGLLWAVVAFALGQVGFLCLIDRTRPEIRDPEYGYKLALLRSRLKKEPGRPLVLVLGTSRSDLGLRPQVLSGGGPEGGPRPLVFNFGISGAGNFGEFLTLRRLIAAGVHPDLLLVEILPAKLDVHHLELQPFAMSRLTWGDLPLLRRYCGDPAAAYRTWWAARLLPWSTYRFPLLVRYAHDWLPLDCRVPEYHIRQLLDSSGWLRTDMPDADPEAARRRVEVARAEYFTHLQLLCPGGTGDQSLRDLLDLCRQRGIRVALFLMPEASEFRSWYSAPGQARLESYLAEIGRSYRVPIVDARTWAGDTDFFDAHHLTPAAAAAFTERFGRDAVTPLLEGSIPAARHAQAELSGSAAPPPHH